MAPETGTMLAALAPSCEDEPWRTRAGCGPCATAGIAIVAQKSVAATIFFISYFLLRVELENYAPRMTRPASGRGRQVVQRGVGRADHGGRVAGRFFRNVATEAI